MEKVSVETQTLEHTKPPKLPRHQRAVKARVKLDTSRLVRQNFDETPASTLNADCHLGRMLGNRFSAEFLEQSYFIP